MGKQIIAMQGAPASGKTTWVQNFMKTHPGWVRVNRDDIRKDMSNPWSPEQEQHAKDIEDFIITSSLNKDLNVIIDDSNLHEKTIQHIEELAEMYEASLEWKKMEVDLQTAIERDANRENPVGEKVIVDFYIKYFPNKMGNYRYMREFNKELPNAILVDLDGTLALGKGRGWFDYDKVCNDQVEFRVAHLIHALQQQKHNIIFITGRDEECRGVTSDWLDANLNIPYRLYMREHDDERPDNTIKLEIFKRDIEPEFNVVAVFEDRNKVVDMWRQQGLLCCQVYYGDF